LHIIAKNQYELAKYFDASSGTSKGSRSSGNTVGAQETMQKPPTVPPNFGFDRKTNVSGKKEYNAIHAKNVEIARGGKFADS